MALGYLKKPAWIRGSVWFALLLVLGPMVFACGAHAAGTTTTVDALTSGRSALRLTIYFNPDLAYPNLRRIAVIAITDGPRVNSVAFDAGDWNALMALWAKALTAQSASWKNVGAFTDTSGAQSSTLTVKAGMGVSFVVNSTAKGALTYVIAPADMDRFGADLRKTQQTLATRTE